MTENHSITPGFYLRAALGGVLMGLANLVPGISGGTMLLAAGVYPFFIAAVADVTRLKLSWRNVILLGIITVAAAGAILFLAGTIKDLVVNHRWIMYSIFIGLTLGGVPLVMKLAKPLAPSVYVAAVISFILMAIMGLGFGNQASGKDASYLFLLLAGLGGASAMILPGVSGGYLLLLLGQYQNILGAIDQVKEGLSSRDMAILLDAMHIVIPVGIGVFIGIVGVSNLLKWLLERYEKPTLGALLGLLFGAVIGIWPFQEGVRPSLGFIFKGKTLNALELVQLPADDWPVQFFNPTGKQIGVAIGLVVAGFVLTQLIEKIGKNTQ